MTTCSRATPVPAIVARPPAPHGVDGAPFGVDNAPINSDGSVTLLSPGTNAYDGFLTPSGKTTPFHAAVPQEIVMPRVTTGNAFGGLAGSNTSKDNKPPPDSVVATPAPAPSAFQMEGKSIADFSLEDVEIGPSTAPTGTMPVPTYWDVQRVVTENLNSLIANIHQSERAHQQPIRQNFRSYMSHAKKEHQDFEFHHSSFLDGIDAKLQAVRQAVKRTVVSFGTNFAVIDATLSKVEENTTQMSGLLETSRTQLHQLRDNKAACVNAMQEHRNRLDDMDTMLICVTKSITKTMNLAHEMDSKILASRPTSKTNHQRPVDCLLAPGCVSPARLLANNMPHSSSVNSVPDHSFVPPGSPATDGPHPPLDDSVPTTPLPHRTLWQQAGCTHPWLTQFPTTLLSRQALRHHIALATSDLALSSVPPCIPQATAWASRMNHQPTLPINPPLLLIGPLQWTLWT
jgi:hypothetical protein